MKWYEIFLTVFALSFALAVAVWRIFRLKRNRGGCNDCPKRCGVRDDERKKSNRRDAR